MALELIHTSSPSGLRPGSSGFCTVAMTTGMPGPLEERLAALGGYRPAPSGIDSPPSFSHLRIEVGGRVWSVLTAVRAAPPDHSGRANKLAHHLVLDRCDMVDAGPAWLLRQPGVVVDHFDGPPRWIPEPRRMPACAAVDPRRCDAWERASGDAGWAGAIVNEFLLDPSRISCIVYGPEVDPLQLADEAIALLLPQDRWRVTFATHFQQPVAGALCSWRFCLRGTSAALTASRRATGIYLDLDDARRSGARARPGKYMALAREGRADWWTRESDRRALPRDAEAGSGSMTAGREIEPADGGLEPLPRTWGAESAVGGHADGAGAAAEEVFPAPADASPAQDHRGLGTGSGAADPSSGGSESDRRRKGGGLAAKALAASALLIAGAAVTLFVEHFVMDASRSGEGSSAPSEQDHAQIERERLRAERDELALKLHAAEESAARAYAEAARLEQERVKLRDLVNSLTAKIQSMEALSPGRQGVDGAAAGAGRHGASTRQEDPARGSAAAPSPRQRDRRSAQPPSQSKASPDSTPLTPGEPPVQGLELDKEGCARFSPARWSRDASLGVISTERQLLGRLPSPVRSLRIDLPPTATEVSVRRAATGLGATVTVAPRGLPAEDLLLVEAEGASLFLKWDPGRPTQELVRHFEIIDSLLPLATIMVELDDGSTLRVHSREAELIHALSLRGTTTVALPVRGSSLRLVSIPHNEWTLAEGATDIQQRLLYQSGSLLAELDRPKGQLRLRLLSPLMDELAAAERDLRKLEMDRPNVAPDEREYQEGLEQQAQERIAKLRERIAQESVPIPASLPELQVVDSHSRRTVVRLRLESPSPDTAEGDEASPTGARP